MEDLSKEQCQYAISRFKSIYTSRGFNQTEFERISGVGQSTISKLLHWPDNDSSAPSSELLEKVFLAFGFQLSDILKETGEFPPHIIGYLATPLTGLSERQDAGVRRAVEGIRGIAAEQEFTNPEIRLYWPGDYTHPKLHPSLTAEQVYLTDRTHASTHDFVFMLCGSPSFGVGQENEIATQAGVYSIRLVPPGISRMLKGSFARSADIEYAGDLEHGIAYNKEDVRQALRDVHHAYYKLRALYRGLCRDSFAARLRQLIDRRFGGDVGQFASDIGVAEFYMRRMLDEPFVVSNPSGQLLMRIAHRLGVRVGYLLGESEEVDGVWVESNASWHSWINSAHGLEASIAVQVRDDWRNEYAINRREEAELSKSASYRRSTLKPMAAKDWDKRYQRATKKGADDGQASLGL